MAVLTVLAVGKPKEKTVLLELKVDADIRYRRDDQGVHHVHERSLEEMIVAACWGPMSGFDKEL